MNLQISPQLMDEMIEEALHHVNRKSCEHTITTQYGDEILLVNVDARLIMQVVVNLVDNAIKYTPCGLGHSDLGLPERPSGRSGSCR